MNILIIKIPDTMCSVIEQQGYMVLPINTLAELLVEQAIMLRNDDPNIGVYNSSKIRDIMGPRSVLDELCRLVDMFIPTMLNKLTLAGINNPYVMDTDGYIIHIANLEEYGDATNQ